MKKNKTMLIDNQTVPIGDERNILEIIRKANIELPTFCYHSEMSIYGACRLCMVDIQGRGLQPACSTLPEDGMVIRTNTREIRSMRKMIIELMLAAHQGDCPTCVKGPDCQLQKLAQRMGISKIRFGSAKKAVKLDDSSPSLVRDPNKCVLCGDCVRMCNEIQSVGAIDFAYRGPQAAVMPCFGKDLASVECVNCGQCARVCPTGALFPKPSINEVWQALHDPAKKVAAQIAPAVRVALGESFKLPAGTITTGKIVAALKRMGFAKIYDTSFAADLTVIEEAEEFLQRRSRGEKLPQFTSCCPAWVSFAEQYYPEYLPNISTCSSPQQMLGSLYKKSLSDDKTTAAEDIIMVTVMPCTAKKHEILRPEFAREYGRDVDYVLTTRELALMIKEMGLNFDLLEQDSFDPPFGFYTGGGVLFGNSGGVTEAVLRYVGEKFDQEKTDRYIFKSARGQEGIREIQTRMGNQDLSLAIVSGLGNARKVLERIKSGQASYDFVEIMACPGGCINGGGQPVSGDFAYKEKRTCGLYDHDQMLQLHKAQENPYITELYENILKAPGSDIAHQLLHTRYQPRKRIEFAPVQPKEEHKEKLNISICFGTSCLLKGAQDLYSGINQFMAENNLTDMVEITATFCFEKCSKGPVIKIGNEVIEKCTLEKAKTHIKKLTLLKIYTL